MTTLLQTSILYFLQQGFGLSSQVIGKFPAHELANVDSMILTRLTNDINVDVRQAATRVLGKQNTAIGAYCTHFYFFISRFREKKTAGLRSWGWMDSSEMWWWFRICNKNIAYHSLSPSFSPLKSIIFTKHRHFVIFACGWSIRARLTNLSWDFTFFLQVLFISDF